MKAILIIAHHCILPGAYKGFEEYADYVVNAGMNKEEVFAYVSSLVKEIHAKEEA